MWKIRLNEIDPITKSAAAALLSKALAQHLFSRQSELCSEIISWTTLPVICKLTRRDAHQLGRETLPRIHPGQPPSKTSLWVVAICLVTACIFNAEVGLLSLYPVLTPLLLIVERHIHRPEVWTSSTSDSTVLDPLGTTVWGTASVAAFTIVTLPDGSILQSALSAIPVAGLLVTYMILTPGTGKSLQFLSHFDIEDAILPLSMRVMILLIVALAAEAGIFGFPRIHLMNTLMVGLAKASSWSFVIYVARHSSWRAATAIGTFSITSMLDPFSQSSDIIALSHVVASFLALGQVIVTLPRKARTKSTLWVCSLACVVPFLANIFTIKFAGVSSPMQFQQHPVDDLIHGAKTEFAALVQKQSSTYESACDEYRRRYRVEPPPGFESWYAFARSHQSPIIDEFDIVYDRISPFWQLSGKEVHEMMERLRNAPNSELWLCEFSGHQARTRCSHPHRIYDRHVALLFDNLLGDLTDILPDVKLLVNHLDEPRVLVLPRSPGERTDDIGQFNVTDLSKRPVWDAITRSCPSQPIRDENQVKHPANTYGLPFITDLALAMDLCGHPEYSIMNGLTQSPTSFRLIEGLVPVLSTGSPSTMGDILYPSPAYIEAEFQYTDSSDVEWDKKRNNLYWAGSNTGGYASDDQWPSYHRQRFVGLAQNLEKGQHYYLREQDGLVSRIASSFLNSRLFDVSFTRIFQCERRQCRDQRRYFGIKPWADRDRALRSRLVFDIDGNGISGRYYRLLASRSLPLKQTLLREWHDDRLLPWVHYVPVSQNMDELPELVFYLTSTQDGQKRAREIAEQGREWFSKAFRRIDMTIYTYRLMLELARLQDPERPAWPVEAKQT